MWLCVSCGTNLFSTRGIDIIMSIEDIILKFYFFCKQKGQYDFYGHQLERFVHQEYVGLIAPDTILRQMRYAQEKGLIDYDCPDKNKSYYIIVHKKSPFSHLK